MEAAQAALRALRNVAGPEHAPALLNVVLRIGSAALRREAAATLASVLRRPADPQIAPVVRAYEAAGDKQVKLTLLDVMGQVSSGGALEVVRGGLKDPDPEIARAAILALSAWQSAEPLADLLTLARTESNPARQILALRGFIKLIAVPADRAPGETVALLKEGWQLANQVAEKRSILALLPLFPMAESLRLAETAAKDQAVAKEGSVAVETLRGIGVR